MTTLIGIVIAVVAAAATAVALWPLVRTYRRFRGTRVITCPESHLPAAVEVDARLAAVTHMSTGTPTLRLAACSRWPERQDCGQECLSQIESAPTDCLARTMLVRWYDGKACVFCRRPIGEIHWSDHKPALRAPGGDTVGWEAIRAETLPAVLASHAPVCWNCHVAETLRREHPELIVDDPPPHRVVHPS
jgi:hypothetical protein